jgi:uncharacterized protein YndB with AHSA1/START domain
VATTDSPAVVEEIVEIDAPIADVYAALTEPDELVQWWGSDNGYRCETMERDLRPGGAWITRGTGSDGKPFSVSGTYTIVDPPNVIAFTWNYDWKQGADAVETLVRYDLSEANGVTTLRVTQSGFTDVTDRDDHAKGWPVVFSWLRAYLAR